MRKPKIPDHTEKEIEDFHADVKGKLGRQENPPEIWPFRKGIVNLLNRALQEGGEGEAANDFESVRRPRWRKPPRSSKLTTSE